MVSLWDVHTGVLTALNLQGAKAMRPRATASTQCDAERAQTTAEAPPAQLSTERLRRRAAERYAATPWWQVRRRCELRGVLIVRGCMH